MNPIAAAFATGFTLGLFTGLVFCFLKRLGEL